jgi:hypothetical protein
MADFNLRAIFNLPQITVSGPEIAPMRVVCDLAKCNGSAMMMAIVATRCSSISKNAYTKLCSLLAMAYSIICNRLTDLIS